MIGAQSKHPIPVSVNKNTPSMRALAMESCGTDCSPAPDVPKGFPLRRNFFFTDTGIITQNTVIIVHACLLVWPPSLKGQCWRNRKRKWIRVQSRHAMLFIQCIHIL